MLVVLSGLEPLVVDSGSSDLEFEALALGAAPRRLSFATHDVRWCRWDDSPPFNLPTAA